MAAFLFLLFLFSFHKAQAQAQAQLNNFNISRGSSLSPTSNSSWLSPSGLYAFGFYREGDGFAVGIYIAGIPEKTVVWTANRDQHHVVASNATLLLTTDGRLILEAQGTEINIANPGDSIASASMLDNGNFVLYRSYANIAWQSFDHPTDTLLPGQRLIANQELYSRASETDYSKGRFRLSMQSDGNLVQYPAKDVNAYYATGTSLVGDKVTLNLEDNGHLFLLNATVNIITNITKGEDRKPRTIYLMRIDVDGIFRVYSHSLDKANWTQIWASTYDGCQPKGRCGFNQFCVLVDQDVSCQCLPGFDFIDEGDQSSGCESDFTAASCKAINQSVSLSMRRSPNTAWDSTPYEVLQINSIEDCEQKCLEDCNCDVALFKDADCRKQRLPLKFGRRDNGGDSQIALIKVGVPVSVGTRAPEGMSKTGKKERTIILIVSISLMLLGISVLVIAGVLFYRTRKLTCNKIDASRNVVVLVDDGALQAFSYAELVQITDDFREEVGRGAFGTVYKGTLSNSQKVVAVKKLENELADGEREFKTEMKVIGRTHHRNLVHLLGYCIDGTKRLLVYEFMCNGSLADVLFTPKNRISWLERVRMASDVARGILYLHEECEDQIIHCDIKPQNILMDENMCAKISDFGLAKLLKPDQTRTYTGVRGTKGYVAPEWHRKMPVNVKVDVYSFGVVLLEIICRRRNVDWSLPEDEAILEEWVYDRFVAGDLGRIVHDEEVDIKNLERLVKIGIWCIQDEPSLRPSMKNVAMMLDSLVDIPLPPNPSSFLRAF